METHLTIGNLTWTVFFVTKDHSKLVNDKGEQSAYGITVFRECEIYIDRELPDELMQRTLTHELVHALAFSYAVELSTFGEEEPMQKQRLIATAQSLLHDVQDILENEQALY